ncbi:MAG: 50S ribosomal protein L15 [Oscillospiraceae bacterium]|nr:50S ribosomal protein L15 [Oscillospiraceae bacterium]
MKLHELSPVKGSNREVKRIGRGHGSGWGKTSGKGHKGQWARSGGGVRPGFEGGQTSLARRMPKRGFTNAPFKTEYAVVNLRDLERRFESGAVVNEQAIIDSGLISKPLDGIKVLGMGELTKKLTVTVTKFSETAKQKIEAAGGKAQEIPARAKFVPNNANAKKRAEEASKK